MCSLEVYCYNKNRDGTEYYQELCTQLDQNHKLKDKKVFFILGGKNCGI